MPDTHPAEALVPEMRTRSPQYRHRQGLRVREGALRRHGRGGRRESPRRVDTRHQPREVHRRYGDRSDLSRAAVLSRAGRPGRPRGVRGDPRRDAGQGRHRQGGALRPRVPGQGAAARARPGDVHAAPRRRNPQHGRDRRAHRDAGEGEAGGSEARQAGDGHVRRHRRFAGISRRLPGGAARDHRREDRGPRSGRAGSRGAAEGGQLDGGASQEPRHDQRVEEDVGGDCARAGREETRAGVTRIAECGMRNYGARGFQPSDQDMKKITLPLVFVALVFAAVPGAQAPRGATAEDYFAFETLGDPRFSPDGSTIAYVVTTVDQKQNRRRSEIDAVPVDGSRPPRALTTAPQSSNSPRWSPDGQAIAFLSARPMPGDAATATPRPQVWLLPLAGGEPRRVTDLVNGVSSFQWSPDGIRLVVVGRTGPSDTAKSPSDVRHYAHANYKFNDSGWFDDKRTHLWVADVKTGTTAQITTGSD